jgi:hypothetical protein
LGYHQKQEITPVDECFKRKRRNSIKWFPRNDMPDTQHLGMPIFALITPAKRMLEKVKEGGEIGRVIKDV